VNIINLCIVDKHFDFGPRSTGLSVVTIHAERRVFTMQSDATSLSKDNLNQVKKTGTLMIKSSF
jgi:hypothetical protein